MQNRINVSDFNLAGTLECGQAFRWQRAPDGCFTGVVGGQVWTVRQEGDVVVAAVHGGLGSSAAETAATSPQRYLSLDVSLAKVVATFPDDEPLRAAVKKHWGLRVLRQEPWETLASFIASSTKQIVQIRQIVANLSARFGRAGCPPPAEDPRLAEGSEPYHCFPSVEVIARATQQQLLDCKLGFRAKYLLAAARAIDSGEVGLGQLPAMEYDRALEELMKLAGVGEKIAACTLLFSCSHDEAFPIDVWIERSLRRLYFNGEKVPAKRLREFTRSHFGPYAGWAQQYLFFQERTRGRQPLLDAGTK